MALSAGEIGPAVGGTLVTGAMIWRGLRDLTRKLDHVESIPVIAAKVDTIAVRVEELHESNTATAKALATHMADEAKANEADRADRAARQVTLDQRLRHMDSALVKIGGYTPPLAEESDDHPHG